MHDKIMAAQKAITRKENEKFVSEVEEFSRAFGIKSCVFGSAMTQQLMRGAKYLDVSEIKISNVVTTEKNGTALLDVYYPKKAVSNKVKLIKAGNGWAIDTME